MTKFGTELVASFVISHISVSSKTIISCRKKGDRCFI